MKSLKIAFVLALFAIVSGTAAQAQCGNDLPSFLFNGRVRVLDMYLQRAPGGPATTILLPRVQTVIAEMVNLEEPQEPGTPKCPPSPDYLAARKFLTNNAKELVFTTQLEEEQAENLYKLSQVPGYKGKLMLDCQVLVEKRVNPTLLPTDNPTYHYQVFLTSFSSVAEIQKDMFVCGNDPEVVCRRIRRNIQGAVELFNKDHASDPMKTLELSILSSQGYLTGIPECPAGGEYKFGGGFAPMGLGSTEINCTAHYLTK